MLLLSGNLEWLGEWIGPAVRGLGLVSDAELELVRKRVARALASFITLENFHTRRESQARFPSTKKNLFALHCLVTNSEQQNKQDLGSSFTARPRCEYECLFFSEERHSHKQVFRLDRESTSIFALKSHSAQPPASRCRHPRANTLRSSLPKSSSSCCSEMLLSAAQ